MTKQQINSVFSPHSHAQREQVRNCNVFLLYDIKANH